MEKRVQLQAERAAVPWPMAVAASRQPIALPGPIFLDPNTSYLDGIWVEVQRFCIVHTSKVFTICDGQPLKGVRGKRKAEVPYSCHRLCMAWSLWLAKLTGVYSDCHYSACLHCSRHGGVNSWLEAVQSLPVQVLLPHKLVQIPLHSQMEILLACQARHLQCTVCACAL